MARVDDTKLNQDFSVTRNNTSKMQNSNKDEVFPIDIQTDDSYSSVSNSDLDTIMNAQETYEENSFEQIESMYNSYDSEIALKSSEISSLQNTNYVFNSSDITYLEEAKADMTSDLTNYQNELSSIFDGTHPEVQEAQSNLNSAQEEYSKAINDSSNPQIVALQDKIEENTLAIAEQETIVSFFDTQIQETTSQISLQTSNISSLEAEIASYSSQISSLNSMLKNADKNTKSAIRTQILALNKLKGNANSRLQNANSVLDIMEEKLKSLEEQKPKEEQKLQELASQRDELERQVAEAKDEAVSTALENLQMQRNTLEEIKAELSAQVKSNIEQANIGLTNLEAQIAQLKQELFKQEQEQNLKNNQEPQTQVYPQTQASVSNNTASKYAFGNQASALASEVLTPEKIKENLNNAKSDLEKNQKALSDIHNGVSIDLSPKRDLQEANFNTLMTGLNEVDPTLADEASVLKSDLDNKEALLDAKDLEIESYEAQIQELKMQALDLDAMSSSLAEVQDLLANVDESKLDSDEKQELSDKKTSLETKLGEVNSLKDFIEQQIKEKEESDEYKQLKEDRTQLKQDYDEALEALEDKLSEATNRYPNLKEVADNYSNSYNDYQISKDELIQIAKGNIVSSQASVEELTKTNAINEADALARTYKFSSGEGEAVADFASNFIGCNEADGSANKFVNGGSSGATPWCAAFVNYVLKNSGEYDDVASWYKNIDNKWYCPNIANSAKNAGAIVDQSDAQAGDIVLFYSDEKGRYSHVGIVEFVDADGTVHTIEGNTSNQVARRTYQQGQRKMTFCNPYA